ncbi:MAG: ATP-binding protein [Gemmatimonas sp.]|nr:ATP-binding protein [Gemmatimonas sp.]
MRLFGKLVAHLAPEDIDFLLRERVAESRRLDYKRDVPTSNEEKADFVNDVCSFANTEGGVILIGIDERDTTGKKTGCAQAIVGIKGTSDEVILRLTQVLNSNITPSIGPIVSFQPVNMPTGETVLALGISLSYARPHREENKRRYLLRNDAGKYEPDVVETRRMFLESESWSEDAERFIDSRFEALRRIPTVSAFAVVHILPLGRLRNRVELAPIYERLAALIPPDGGGLRIRPNLHGVCGQTSDYEDATALQEQIQVFRFGGVEFVSGRAFAEGTQWGKRIFGDILTNNVRSVIKNSVGELTRLFAVDAPFALSLAVVGGAGYKVTAGNRHMFHTFEVAESPLRIPPVILEAGGDLDTSIRQLTDVFWESVGARHPYWPDDSA